MSWDDDYIERCMLVVQQARDRMANFKPGKRFWNYRVVRQPGDGPLYVIQRAEYTSAQQTEDLPFALTEAEPVYGDSVEDLVTTLRMMLAAVDKPVVEADDVDDMDAVYAG